MKKINLLFNVRCVIIAFTFLTIPFALFAQIPSGFIAKFPFDNNSAIDVSGNSYDASFTGSVTDLNRFGTANSAVAFSQNISMGSFPRSLATAVRNDFTIGFWFKTTMVSYGSGAWYSGNALIDAEVCGGTDDWGMALINGGAVSFGIGSSDITIESPLNTYNDGAWHYVTATRNRTAGTIKLYMEGVEVASTTGANTGELSAPTSIGMGSNPCGNYPVYTGNLDDVIFYDRVLSGTEITDLYNTTSASVLPLRWISFTGAWRENKALLKWEVATVINNDHFEIESSNNGIQFTRKAIVANNGNTTNTTHALYSFLDNNTETKTTQFYRIKQIDTDGRFSYSKTIKLSMTNGISKKISLQSNPVINEIVLMNDGRAHLYNIEVVDVSGRLVLNKSMLTADAVIRHDVQQLKTGYYTLRITTSAGTTVLPFIKK